MLAEFLHDRAALYVSGAMTAAERESFELILEFHGELRAHVAELQGVAAAVILSRIDPTADAPPTELRSRLLATLDARAQIAVAEPEGFVVTDRDGLVQWVNPAFIALCGYSLDEIKGRKPGHLLQGPATDPAPVQRMREALRERRACREELINYHKDGTPYRVGVAITPILDDEQEPVWLVARERKLPL